jgi:hypothetical protein
MRIHYNNTLTATKYNFCGRATVPRVKYNFRGCRNCLMCFVNSCFCLIFGNNHCEGVLKYMVIMTHIYPWSSNCDQIHNVTTRDCSHKFT